MAGRAARRIQERIQISADTRQATIAVQQLTRTVQRGFERMEQAVRNAIPRWVRVGQVIQTVDAAAGVLGRTFNVVSGAVNSAIRATEEFSRQETGINQMRRAFEGVGLATDEVFAQVEALAGERQRLTRFGDDVTRSIGHDLAVALNGTRLSWEQMRRSIVLTQDVMQATGRSSRESAQIVARSIAGNAEAIGELLPAQREHLRELARTADASQVAEAAVQALSQAYGGAAESISDAELAVARLRNGLGDLRERFGQGIAEVLNRDGNLERLLGTLDQIVQATPAIVDAFVSIANAVTPLISIFARAADGLARLSREFGEAVGGAGARATELQRAGIDARIGEIETRLDEIAAFESPGRPLRQGPLFRERDRLLSEREDLQRRARALTGPSDVEARATRREFERMQIAAGEGFDGLTITAGGESGGGGSRGGGGGGAALDITGAILRAQGGLGGALEQATAALLDPQKAKQGALGGGPQATLPFFASLRDQAIAVAQSIEEAIGGAFSSIADAARSANERAISEFRAMSAEINQIATGLAQIFMAAGARAGDGFVRGVGTALAGLQSALSLGEAAMTGNPLSIFGALVGGIGSILGALGIGSSGGGGSGQRAVRTVDPFRGLGGGLGQSSQQALNLSVYIEGSIISDDLPMAVAEQIQIARARGAAV